MKSQGNAGANTIDSAAIDVVIFDMDGVVTETAGIHAMAWKQLFDGYLRQRAEQCGESFEPFDVDTDYYRYVDGKPRYDGVESFLKSRGISLPRGTPDDAPGQETVCGLGNLKNEYFLQIVKKQGVTPYRSTIEIIRNLRAQGIKTAVISSSRNCASVLEAAGVKGLFDARVDGVDAAELSLEGKPAPAIFLEAAKRLEAKPERAAIAEDSLAGVEAGRRGGFALVIGVDRGNQGEELKRRGANIVVRDLAELKMQRSRSSTRPIPSCTLEDLPSALEKMEEIFDRLSKGTPAVFLDYDGTLTPIVDDPAEAVMAEDTRRAVQGLAAHWTVSVISGRDLDDVQSMVGIGDIVYAGSHGFDIAGPGDHYRDAQRGESFVPALDRAETELHRLLEDIPGVRVERKRFAIAVHYRNVDHRHVGTLEQRVDQVVSQEPKLRKSHGKKVLELRPNIDWDKGRALEFLIDSLFSDSGTAVPLFIGDDVTDEDAFRIVWSRGVGVVVGNDERETMAHYKLKDTEEVRAFLEGLLARAGRESSAGVWKLVYEGFDPDQEGLREALCTLGNGYFATRGAAPESSADGVHYPGTYVAGCYNRLKSEISGHTIENESLVNVPNWLPLTFRLENGNWFDLQQVNLLDFRQELDLRRGVLSRFVRFSDEQGRRVRLAQRRFVHMADPHLAGLETTIVAENWSGNLYIRSALDGTVTNSGVERYRQLNNGHLVPLANGSVADDTIYLLVEANQSHIRIAEAARTRLLCDGERVDVKPREIKKRGYISQEFSVHLDEEKPLIVEKVVALFTSRDRAVSESGLEARKKVQRSPGFDDLLRGHILTWHHLWLRCRIAIEDSERLAMILHLHIFHLLQTVSENSIDLDIGVPPRGFHGEAYRGHVLWDELFIFPFLNLRLPELTRALLRYRYRRLPEARWAAKEAGYEGAMYPWQSGSDGREESQKLHLNPLSGRWISDNSHLQRHINIAIAYNVWLYYQVTADISFLSFHGAEILIEIARFWASIAQYNTSLGRYEIRKVMGPDEYHDSYPEAGEPGIDNNAYTNIMAAWVLCRALEVLELLPQDRRQALWDRLALRREELKRWDEISRKMRVVFHDNGIISQFEGYDQLEEFDWEGYRERYGNIQRLDRILEAEGDTPNRYKFSKQADVLMLFYLLSADELREQFQRLNYPFEYDTIPKNIDYYLKRTAHGSTLSRIVHSWVLARSQRELSWHLFNDALESDVSDVQGGTTAEGIHLGAMAGTVDLIQRCYTGIETRQDTLWLNPYLPRDLKGMQFDLRYRQHWVNVLITGDRLKLSTRRYDTAPIRIGLRDKVFELKPGASVELELER